MFDAKVGDTIEILNMQGEPEYTGRTGVVELIDGIGQLHGTWGSLAVTDGDSIRVIENKPDIKLKKIAEGYCPVCGSSCISYGSMDIEDNVVSYPAQCNDCGATYYEDYILDFCGISEVRNKDGERLGVVINLKGEEECPID